MKWMLTGVCVNWRLINRTGKLRAKKHVCENCEKKDEPCRVRYYERVLAWTLLEPSRQQWWHLPRLSNRELQSGNWFIVYQSFSIYIRLSKQDTIITLLCLRPFTQRDTCTITHGVNNSSHWNNYPASSNYDQILASGPGARGAADPVLSCL